MRKRAQNDGKGIAVLLLLLALFVVLYLLLLPPEIREDILNQTYGENGNDFSPKLLLSETPGEVYSTKSGNIIHEFSPISLFIKTEPKTDRLANSLDVSKSLFSSKPQILTFDIEDLNNIKGAFLFFNVIKGKGNLELWLNGNIILDREVSAVQSIELPINYLKKNKNVLEIRASSPGILFLFRNFYSLSDIIVKTEYKRLNPQEDRTFSISTSEKDGLQTAKLSFSVYCNDLEKDTAELNVYVNDKSILSKQTYCSGGSESIEIATNNINEGKNMLTFSISDGDFQFSQIKLETKSKESTYPQYHFDVKTEDHDYIVDGTAKAVLNLKLGSGSKKSDFMINGHTFTMDTSLSTYNKDVTDLIESGDNYIKIIPKGTFTIENLEIKLESA
ncbi:MAG: hypothetical protein PHD81_02915 [Candidatus Nanoarchaeia archaeon]|nr:hypothetical protein [Candidatus Nanoarchaeia archaeon]MDD5588036.1 hypothetical protein [Candidatus Nanoarchaeia archaeon]